MTERIDLDELDAGDGDDEAEPNPGDWFWRDEEGPESSADDPAVPEGVTDVKTSATEATPDSERSEAATSDSSSPSSDPIPRVPRENQDRPAGVPADSGGAGAGANSSATADASASGDASAIAGAEPEATGSHGGGADDMTLAFTYEAATRFPNFGAVALDADGWADWVGLVGRVPAHVLNKFQRDRSVDLDFFNGSARGPAERLAAVGPTSMFYAERMVLVGVEGEDEGIAERADWEFVPLSEAAEEAGWEVAEDSTGSEDSDASHGGDADSPE